MVRTFKLGFCLLSHDALFTLFVILSFVDPTSAIPKSDRQRCPEGRRPPNPYHPETPGFALQITFLRGSGNTLDHSVQFPGDCRIVPSAIVVILTEGS
jgi:hypothetical protein